eukprot:CAMPEP_0197239098 /NCGR_PEP_ID=MMETSP1429-20130617/5605_1 /TAXON_ID=49237 /ORGANISM="Chaetoceros  sp., Strain UNC1202" /LENGTH=48 /DNA_ID= /DNA_START= /DNA_END= /DNA_ORIENTATION=
MITKCRSSDGLWMPIMITECRSSDGLWMTNMIIECRSSSDGLWRPFIE